MEGVPVPVCRVCLKQQESPLKDITGTIRSEFEKLKKRLIPGMRIAVAVGSRGISNESVIVRELIRCCLEAGTRPFIIPAMGSHGGATAEGQKQVLEGYGISENSMGVPVLSSMEPVLLEKLHAPAEIPVYMDRNACSADGVITVNRVKIHTDFEGIHESGIVKMLVIGLGKQKGAETIHRYGADGLRDLIPVVAETVLNSGKILAGLAILEDGRDQTADIRLALPEDYMKTDAAFLERSRKIAARLPFREIDTLVIDRIGKEFSGTGMDPNVIGRRRIFGQPDGKPFCRRIAALDLSDGSHGNAIGIGLADVITQKLLAGINWDATYKNVITSGFLERGFLPIVAPTERDAVSIAVRSCGKPLSESFRFARIRDTLHLNEAWLSAALVKEMEDAGAGTRLSDYRELRFDEEGTASALR